MTEDMRKDQEDIHLERYVSKVYGVMVILRWEYTNFHCRV
jgi:hypothetical protein